MQGSYTFDFYKLFMNIVTSLLVINDSHDWTCIQMVTDKQIINDHSKFYKD